MLLVLAHPDDVTAERFVFFARSRGVPCTLLCRNEDVQICVLQERNGRVSVEMRAGNDRSLVRGVLNRGLPCLSDVTPEEQFRAAETLAVWWSVLACFAGPVVNRPSRSSFIPDLNATALARSTLGVEMVPICIGTKAFGPFSESLVNMHSLRDGHFLGRAGEDGGTTSCIDELILFTAFDPTQTVNVLLAGDRMFDLADETGHLAPKLREQLSNLADGLWSRGATFSHIVLQRDAEAIRLVYATSLPGLNLYQHIEDEVHSEIIGHMLK